MNLFKRITIGILIFSIVVTSFSFTNVTSIDVLAAEAPKASSTFEQTGNYRKDWITGVKRWCSIMEKDANKKAWKYMTSQGEKTNYSTNRKTQRYTNCALMVVHAMQYVGLLERNQKFFAKYKTHSTVYVGKNCKETIDKHASIIHLGGKYTSEELINKGKLKKGDILCFYNYQHVAVYYGEKDGYHYWYDAGSGTTKEQKKGGYWGPDASFRRKISMNDKGNRSEKKKIPSVYQDMFLGKPADIIRVDNKNYTLHKTPILSDVSYKVQNKKLYATFTVTNHCNIDEKIKIKRYIGSTKGGLDGEAITRYINVKAKSSKTYTDVLVSEKKVSDTRRYMTIKMKCSGGKLFSYYKKINPAETIPTPPQEPVEPVQPEQPQE